RLADPRTFVRRRMRMSRPKSTHPAWGSPRALAIVALALSAGASDPSAQQRDRYTLMGDKVAIHNLAGELRVEPGTGSAVVVEVVRGGRDAGALSVRTGEHRGIPTLAVSYPGRRVVYPRIPGHWSVRQTADGGLFKEHLDLLGQREITVSGSGSGIEAWADLRVLVPKGKSVIFRHLAGRASIHDVEGDLVVDHGVGKLEVRGVRGRVALDTGSGEVTVSNIQGDLTVDSGSGAVTISDLRGGALVIDSGSGRVQATHVDVDALNADTGSGDVSLRGIAAQRILLDTGSGSVQLDLVED